MMPLEVKGGDINCRYLAAPGSRIEGTQLGKHLIALGVRWPTSLPLSVLVARGWIRPRFRVVLPREALLSWTDFPLRSMEGVESCPPDQEWALTAWCRSTSIEPVLDLPVEKLWMHWLDDPDSACGKEARAHAVEVEGSGGALLPFRHPRYEQEVLPWIDYFADWQCYHLAQLLEQTNFAVNIGPGHDAHCADMCRRHVEDLEKRSQSALAGWRELGRVFDWISSYRTILANCVYRESRDFGTNVRHASRTWAAHVGVTEHHVRQGFRTALLVLWKSWHDRPSLASNKLLLRLQQDIQYATKLLEALTDKPTDPFDSAWYWPGLSRGFHAQLLDALPNEEWLAQRDFPDNAVQYQRRFPRPFIYGPEQMAERIAASWPTCIPLRRFCLAWVRLHGEMRGRDRDLPADATIQANERIEQFNLIALHTERLLRFVDDVLRSKAPARPSTPAAQPDIGPVTLRAVQAATRVVDRSNQNSVLAEAKELIKDAGLRDRPGPEDMAFRPADLVAGSVDAKAIVAAHLNFLVARHYAAHHDYLDDALIYPAQDESKPHPGGTLMSSCLLVVMAALHSLPSPASAPSP